MNAPPETRPQHTDPLAPEWERVELLALALAGARQGREPGAELLDPLRALQDRIQGERRAGGAWNRATGTELGSLELDVLACALAPEAEPRLGWLLQHLMPGTTQPWPSPALIHDLLVLDSADARALYAALEPGAPLRTLLAWDDDPWQPLRPRPAFSARLLGRPLREPPPPGALRVAGDARRDELVLPADRLALLDEFKLWLSHRDTVEGRWGARIHGGPLALFSGPSGTGKTFAAQILAAELGWPLYRVDLGRLVSKYIGETEKNLNRLFDAADGRELVLLFDEADALFGKRGEIKEARDRYANMEVSHLLARIEGHRGPCILTTNLRSHIDPAFARRFQIVVDFPRPDAAARAELWARLLPPQAPRDRDVDPAFLGAAVSLSGGGIRNAALHAAFLAAPHGQIALAHVALAVWRELAKDGRELNRADLGALAPHLPEGLRC
jgi:hypothetical protein